MEFGSERYYRSSGASPIGGVVLSLVIGVGAAAILAFAYSFIDWYNPIIYLTCLATCGLSFVTGVAVVFGLTLGKVRNRMVGALIGLVAGFASLYFAWVFFLWILSGYEALLFNPNLILALIQLIGENGLWEIKGSTPTGWGLYTFWLIEAGIMLIGPTLLGWQHNTPFCEACDLWAEEVAFPGGMQISHELETLKRDLEDEQYESLRALITGSHDAENYLQMKFWMCPSCEDSTWLTLEQITTTTNAKGESNTSTDTIVENLVISRREAEELLSTTSAAPVGGEPLLTDLPQETAPTDQSDEDFWEAKPS
jgi:hypothetical protein